MSMEDIALGITCLCVRNTAIEDYHAAGKITDAEMKVFNKQVANKIYTALTSMIHTDETRRFAATHLFETSRPHNWDAPEIDPGMVKAIDRLVTEVHQAEAVFGTKSNTRTRTRR